jgi:hypothetical protein
MIVCDLCLRHIIKNKGKRITQDNHLGHLDSPVLTLRVRFSKIVFSYQNVRNTILFYRTISVSYTLYYQTQQNLQFTCFRTRKTDMYYII